jgi:transitional endoplasmic reticulum ATPase
MASKTVATTQAQLQAQALAQLAVIGGKLTKDDDIVYEGRRWVFPEQFRGDLVGMQKFISRYIESQVEEIIVDRTFDYRPLDGAHAVYHCLKQYFGYAQSKAREGIFGKQPPNEITIDTGFINGEMQRVTVPFGSDMILPGLTNAVLTITQINTKSGPCLRLVTRVRRVEKEVVDGFYNVVADFLDVNSIYRGRAVNGAMQYFDTDLIDPEQIIYTHEAMRRAEAYIFSPMKHSDVLMKAGLGQKRVVLLEGPYGTGKSEMGRIGSKIAVQNGWTAIIARPGQDDPFTVLQTAQLYQKAPQDKGVFVFVEDVDTFSESMDPQYVTRLLDAFDGFENKGLKMLLVLTTNHADRIHKGMLRPGRIHGMIHIGEMDREGVEKLARRIIGNSLEDNVDFDAVFAACEGYMPAFVREGIERSMRFSIARLGRVGKVSTEDLVDSCESLRDQLDLMEGAKDKHETLPALDRVFRHMMNEEVVPPIEQIAEVVSYKVKQKINETQVVKANGDRFGLLQIEE